MRLFAFFLSLGFHFHPHPDLANPSKCFYLRDDSVTAEVISWHSEIEEENK
jgi:hypothetical protein